MSATIKSGPIHGVDGILASSDRTGDDMNFDGEPGPDHAHRIVNSVLIVNDELLR